MKEAQLYQALDDNRVQCLTCAHYCKLADEQFGVCKVRQHVNGKIVSHVYGKLIANHVDPIEKKPLFHFMPGSRAFSIATVGCNMHCFNCQNADISQMPRDHGVIQGQFYSAETIVKDAIRSESSIIAYTYTEPAIYFDTAFDTAVQASEQGLKNIFVTNGYLSKESLTTIAPYLHGANVDLKFFDEAIYQKICGVKLQPVLDTIKRMRDLGIWVEITTLLIPGLNDDEQTLKQIADFIIQVDSAMPWHITRFHPTYKMLDRPATPISALQNARIIGMLAGIKYVYTGNIPGDEGENTRCPHCKQYVIERMGFSIHKINMTKGVCKFCKHPIDGVWNL